MPAHPADALASAPAPITELRIFQITCAEGRSTEQKKALYLRIADNVSADAGVSRADVIISLVETKCENWSLGNGLAPFA